MKVRPGVIALCVLLTAVGAFIYWFLTHFDRVPVESSSGYSKEARVNPLLAAELLFERLGLEADSIFAFHDVPSIGTVVFLPVSRREYPAARTDELIEWVESGGHLIVVAAIGDEEGSNDPLIERFGVVGTRVEDAEGNSKTTTVAFPGLGEDLRVEFSSDYALETSDEPLAAGAAGVHAVSKRAGQGRLTVLSDYQFAINQRIDEHDHAVFLWFLVNLDRPANVWLFYRSESFSLLDRILEVAWQVVVAATLLVVLFVWGVSRRFGPLLADEEEPRRRLLEHIDASGRFLWKHGEGVALLDDLRHSLLRNLEYRHPGWSTAHDLVRKLADLASLSPESVKHALEIRTVKDETEFMRTVRVLETIRNQL